MKIRNLMQKTAVYLVTLGIGKVLSVVLFAVLAQVLLPEKFGEITIFMTASQLLTVLFDLGLKQWYQKQAVSLEEKGDKGREVMASKNKLLSNVLGARLGLSLLSMVFLAIINPWWPKLSGELWWLLSATLIIEAMFSVADAYYLEKRQSLILGLKLIGRNVLLLSCFIWVRSPENVQQFYIVYVISMLVVMIFYFPWRQVGGTFRVKKIWQEKKLWKRSAGYGIMDGLSMLYSRIDSVLVDIILGATSLGIYSAAYRILEGFNLIPQALFHNLFPESSKKGNISWRQLWKIEGVMVCFGLGLGALTWIMAELIIWLIMGDAYGEASIILRVLAIVNFLFFANAPFNIIIQSSDRLKKYIPWMALIVIINLSANLILIPRMGAIGAAWAMVISQAVLIIVNYFFVKKIYERRQSLWTDVKKQINTTRSLGS